MSEHASGLGPKQVDFLYWHAVSKMRMADFEAAETLFRLLHAACPGRTDVALGRAYCLLRLSDFEAATAVVTALRRRPLRAEEMALLGRLQRRCEFERSRDNRPTRARQRAGATPGEPVRIPHSLGDDAMARQAAEQR